MRESDDIVNSRDVTVEFTARIKKLAVEGHISREWANGHRAIEYRGHLMDEMILQLERRVAAGDVTEEFETIRYPANWKEAVKEAVAKWLTGRDEEAGRLFSRYWPVRYITRTFPCRITRMCPHIKIPHDHHLHKFFLLNRPAPHELSKYAGPRSPYAAERPYRIEDL